MNVFENIQAGKYNNQVKYEQSPAPAPLLSKKAFELTPEELASIPDLKQAHLDAVDACLAKVDAYYKGEAAAVDLFWHDACEELGMPIEHPFVNMLMGRAWASGHAYGLGEVFMHFSDMYELWSWVKDNCKT